MGVNFFCFLLISKLENKLNGFLSINFYLIEILFCFGNSSWIWWDSECSFNHCHLTFYFSQFLFIYFFLQKLIPEMQKLFSTKNESNVLKLWPLFVKLLGKVKHAHDHATSDLSFVSTDEVLHAGKCEMCRLCLVAPQRRCLHKLPTVFRRAGLPQLLSQH